MSTPFLENYILKQIQQKTLPQKCVVVGFKTANAALGNYPKNLTAKTAKTKQKRSVKSAQGTA